MIPKHALLLDVDGTLVDDLQTLRGMWTELSETLGLDPNLVIKVAASRSPSETFRYVAPHLNVNACIELLHAFEDQLAARPTDKAFEGAKDLLHSLPRGQWALVTSNYQRRVRVRFRRLGLPLPEIICDAESVVNGKPSPESYLLAANLLGIHPSDCLVVEDSESGCLAGRLAGMTVWAVNTTEQIASAHRSFARLEQAVPELLAFVDSSV